VAITDFTIRRPLRAGISGPLNVDTRGAPSSTASWLVRCRSASWRARFPCYGPRSPSTRVNLEHRYFERHGAGADRMRDAISSEGGWGMLLQLFARKAEE